MSTPQSVINICSGVRLDSRYLHSIYFANQASQVSYFAGKVVKTFSAYSYIRKTWPLKVQATMEQAKTWNYLYFRNGTGKYYFYFINNIEYINDSTVELSLEIDVLQTYLFDWEMLPCFVERQHTETDEIGQHTVEEGLDVGDLICNGTQNIDPGKLAIMVMCTTNPNATTAAEAVNALPYMYNRVFSGVKIWAVNPDRWALWGNQMDTLDEIGKSESIVAMWMYPMQMVKLGGEASWVGDDLAVPVEGATSQDNGTMVYSIGKNLSDLDGYVPRNNKLFCSPFNFAYCTNNQGGSAVYRYERFGTSTMGFVLSGSLAPDGGLHLTPLNYNGLDKNYHEGMGLGNFPSCAWNSDVYKLWLAQNQGSQFVDYATAGLKIVGGVGMAVASAGVTATGVGAVPGVAGVGAGLATVANGAQQIAGLLAQNHDREIVPPQAKGGFSSSVNITNNMQAFTIQHKSVTAEMGRNLDDFLTMYGYRLNEVRYPNLKARTSFTHVKTIGCTIQGNMCTEDIVKVESIFDNGVTWWVDGDQVGNYLQSNDCFTVG